MHTRVGAVVLFSPGALLPTEQGETVLAQAKLIPNPHAKIPLPGWITETIKAVEGQFQTAISRTS